MAAPTSTARLGRWSAAAGLEAPTATSASRLEAPTPSAAVRLETSTATAAGVGTSAAAAGLGNEFRSRALVHEPLSLL